MAHTGTAYRTESGDVLFSVQLLLAREQDEDRAPSDRSEWAAVLAIPAVEAPGPAAAVEPLVLPDPVPQPEREPRREAERSAPPPHLRRLREAEPALRDPSTGAATAAALERDLKLDRGRLHGGAFTLAVVDVVPLVEIRKRSGDESAEEILRALVEAVPFVLRGGDRIYRTGPDELALLLPGSDLTGAAAMCIRLQTAVRDVLVRRELPEIMLSARPFERAA